MGALEKAHSHLPPSGILMEVVHGLEFDMTQMLVLVCLWECIILILLTKQRNLTLPVLFLYLSVTVVLGL